jgi:hypothetical protein
MDTPLPEQPGNSWMQQDLVPRPDPSVLTNQAFERAKEDYRREVHHLRELLEQAADLRMEMLNERYQTQTKATDAAFVAQQTAMKTAFDAADKAVQAALAAAEKAADKAENAANERFKATNEFRDQQKDIIAGFISRVEFTAEQNAMDGRVTALTDRFNSLELRLSSRLDVNQGQDQGMYRANALSEGKINQKLVLYGIVISVVIIIAQVVLSLAHL